MARTKSQLLKRYRSATLAAEENQKLNMIARFVGDAYHHLITRFEEVANQQLYALNPEIASQHHLVVTSPMAARTLNNQCCTAQVFVDVCRTACKISSLLHDNNYIHGDMSLANVLILEDEQGQFKNVIINDFGSVSPINTSKNQVAKTQLFQSHYLDHHMEYEPLDDWVSLFYVLVAFSRHNVG